MKNNKKTAFSMTEIIVVLVFISFIMIYELMILNSKSNEYSASYYNAYNTLKKVAYNIYLDIDYQEPRLFPDDAKELCNRLSEFLNIPESKNYCEKAEHVNKNANNISKETLAFITSNANKFYIDDNKYTYIFKDKNNNEKKVEYFILYVDINGEKGPNRVDSINNNKILPDIVPFAITTKGELIPMGHPVYSANYMTARIRYPEKKENIKEEYLSESVTFNEAIQRAWGDGVDIDIPMTYRLTDEIMKIDGNLIKKSLASLIPAEKTEIEESKECEAYTYNCKVFVDSGNNTRF